MVLMLKLYSGVIKKDVIFIKMHVLVPVKVMMNFVNLKMKQNVQVVEREKEDV